MRQNYQFLGSVTLPSLNLGQGGVTYIVAHIEATIKLPLPLPSTIIWLILLLALYYAHPQKLPHTKIITNVNWYLSICNYCILDMTQTDASTDVVLKDAV